MPIWQVLNSFDFSGCPIQAWNIRRRSRSIRSISLHRVISIRKNWKSIKNRSVHVSRQLFRCMSQTAILDEGRSIQWENLCWISIENPWKRRLGWCVTNEGLLLCSQLVIDFEWTDLGSSSTIQWTGGGRRSRIERYYQTRSTEQRRGLQILLRSKSVRSHGQWWNGEI